MRIYRVEKNEIKPISFRVPRKNDMDLHQDIFIPTKSAVPSHSLSEWLNNNESIQQILLCNLYEIHSEQNMLKCANKSALDYVGFQPFCSTCYFIIFALQNCNSCEPLVKELALIVSFNMALISLRKGDIFL